MAKRESSKRRSTAGTSGSKTGQARSAGAPSGNKRQGRGDSKSPRRVGGKAVSATRPARVSTPQANTESGKKPARRSVGGSERPAPEPANDPRPVRLTHLTDKELVHFRDLLLSKRAELCGDLARLTDEALSGQGRGRGETSAMPIHMADLGTDNWEQEFTLGLLANEQALIREIDEALQRIEAKTYGICLGTGKTISKARLRATPWAKYCIEYARALEEGRVH